MTPTPIRVVHCIGTLDVGGAERQITELIRRLPPDRFEQHLVLLRKEGALLADLADADCEIVGLGPPRVGRAGRVRARLRLPFVMLRFVRYLRRTKPDIVHAQLPMANIMAATAARLARVPTVITSQLNLCRDRDGRTRLQRIENRALRSADAVFANSLAVIDDLIACQGVEPGRIRLIHNGVDLLRFVPRPEERLLVDRRAAAFAPDERVIACIANMHPYKGHEDLLRAFAILDPAADRLRLLLIGRDEGAEPGCRALVSELGIADQVRFAGEAHAVEDLLSFVEFTVHPSHEEGFPNVVLEAMAAGKAVVATDVGGVGEAIDDGVTGLLVAPKDPRALAGAIRGLLVDTDRAEVMGRAGRERVEGHFGIDRMVAEFESWYLELAGAQTSHLGSDPE